MAPSTSGNAAKNQYFEELQKNAKQIASAGKGALGFPITHGVVHCACNRGLHEPPCESTSRPASAAALAPKFLCAFAGILAADESTGTIGKRVRTTAVRLKPSGGFACAAELHASSSARTLRNSCRIMSGCLSPHCGEYQCRYHACVDTLFAPRA